MSTSTRTILICTILFGVPIGFAFQLSCLFFLTGVVRGF